MWLLVIDKVLVVPPIVVATTLILTQLLLTLLVLLLAFAFPSRIVVRLVTSIVFSDSLRGCYFHFHRVIVKVRPASRHKRILRLCSTGRIHVRRRFRFIVLIILTLGEHLSCRLLTHSWLRLRPIIFGLRGTQDRKFIFTVTITKKIARLLSICGLRSLAQVPHVIIITITRVDIVKIDLVLSRNPGLPVISFISFIKSSRHFTVCYIFLIRVIQQLVQFIRINRGVLRVLRVLRVLL